MEPSSRSASAPPASRILPALAEFVRSLFTRRVDALIVGLVLTAIGVILYFLDQKLAFLNFFFLPVLVAGYYVSARTAVLSGMLSVAWVAFFVVLDPGDFHQEMTRLGLYLSLLLWASFLTLSGAIVGLLADRMRGKVARTERDLGEIQGIREKLSDTNHVLRLQNEELARVRERFESALHSVVDPRLARRVVERDLRPEKRSLTVLGAELVGGLPEGEGALAAVSKAFSALEPVVAIFRGHLDRFLGDGLVAEFGMPLHARCHPLLAAAAARRMQEALELEHSPFQLRIGLACGPAWFGLVGSERRRNPTAVGETVDLAARLQGLCPPGSVLVDGAVHDFVKRWFHSRRVGDGPADFELQGLEARLALLEETLAEAPSARVCLEAAELSFQLGDMRRAARFHKRALELEPARRASVERAAAAGLLASAERVAVRVKGARRSVAAYELLAFKDPLADAARAPAVAARLYRRFAPSAGIPEDALLSVEALDGSIGHGRLCAALSAATAYALGLGEESVRDAFLAGYLHDAGKRRVPEHLLSLEERQANMPEPDRLLLQSHVMEGPKVLGELELAVTDAVVEAVGQHHERLDGSGYPGGLRGEQIGRLARIVAIADLFESWTAWRPYGEAQNPAEALARLRVEIDAGRLDRECGEAFLKLMGA